MIEAAVGLITIGGWVFGLWCYPKCVEYVSDCCDKHITPNSNVAINEAEVEFAQQEFEGNSSFPANELLPAKYFKWGHGDSPLFDRVEKLPVAKLLKVA